MLNVKAKLIRFLMVTMVGFCPFFTWANANQSSGFKITVVPDMADSTPHLGANSNAHIPMEKTFESESANKRLILGPARTEGSISELKGCDCEVVAMRSPIEKIIIPNQDVEDIMKFQGLATGAMDVEVITLGGAADEPSRWDKYKIFAKNFSELHGKKINSANAATYKRLFVKSLIDAFGLQEAGLMIQAITAFGEAASREDENAQLAELAAVVQVLDNRAQSSRVARSRVLKDIGVSAEADRQLTVALADWQFSVWNDRDPNLRRMLSFNPEKVDPATLRRMNLAFEVQEKMDSQTITFIGQMANPKIHHYHSSNIRPPDWSDRRKKVVQAIVRIKSEDGQSYEDVDLNAQNGTRHIFYAAVR